MRRVQVPAIAAIAVLLSVIACQTDETIKPPSYTIVYHANGGSGSMEDSAHVYGAAKNLNANAFTRTGYAFAGWAASPDGEAVYTDRQSVSNLTQEDGAVITLYAQWSGHFYSVVYHPNGGGGSMDNSTHVYGAFKDLNTNAFIRAGYSFTGWSDSPTGPAIYMDGQGVSNLSNAAGAEVQLYAVWEALPVTGVTLNFTRLTLVVNETEKLIPLVQPAEALNKNVSWNSDASGTASVAADGTVTAVSAGTVTITVSTEANGRTAECTVTVLADSGMISMAWIPAGRFTMGSPQTEPGRESDETQHQVTLTSGFFMGKYPVTQEQYQTVMGTNPSWFSIAENRPPTAGETDAKRPVEQVSWYDAVVFCNKLSMQEGLSPAYRINGSVDPAEWGSVPTEDIDETWDTAEIVSGSNGYRLPTEAQWEYACRAGTGTAYNTGDTINTDTGWYEGNSRSRTHEAGLKAPNAWGLYDMHGNVFEWCRDWYGSYDSGPQTDPAGEETITRIARIMRGGAWSYSGAELRSAYRGLIYAYWRSYELGFRVIRP